MQEVNFPLNAFYNNGKQILVEADISTCSPNELINGHFYVFKGNVWRYEKKLPSRPKEFPVISFTKDLSEIVTLPSIVSPGIITLESILTNRLNIISERTPEDADFSKDLNIAAVASSSAIYEPEILEKDDFLKKLIKMVFLLKRVATTKYRKKLSKSYAFSNMFQGLNNDTKVSTTVWQTWIEILGVDCIIILKDSGADREDPIGKYVVYKSRNDSLDVIDKDKISDFLSENL